MLTVHFKTGQTLDINQEAAKVLRQKVLSGANKFQFFSDVSSDDVVYVINLEEVVCISPKK